MAAIASAQDAAQDFRVNCMSCHTIGGGRLTGPDLKNVESRRDRAWLLKFLQNPKAVIEAGDPYAVKLKEEARGVVMPTLPGMTPERAAALLDLIAAESKLERSQFAGLSIPETPFTPQDIAFAGRSFWARSGSPRGVRRAFPATGWRGCRSWAVGAWVPS